MLHNYRDQVYDPQRPTIWESPQLRHFIIRRSLRHTAVGLRALAIIWFGLSIFIANPPVDMFNLPQLPGTRIIAHSSLVGRDTTYRRAEMIIDADVDGVRAFYHEVLPENGWTFAGEESIEPGRSERTLYYKWKDEVHHYGISLTLVVEPHGDKQTRLRLESEGGT